MDHHGPPCPTLDTHMGAVEDIWPLRYSVSDACCRASLKTVKTAARRAVAIIARRWLSWGPARRHRLAHLVRCSCPLGATCRCCDKTPHARVARGVFSCTAARSRRRLVRRCAPAPEGKTAGKEAGAVGEATSTSWWVRRRRSRSSECGETSEQASSPRGVSSQLPSETRASHPSAASCWSRRTSSRRPSCCSSAR